MLAFTSCVTVRVKDINSVQKRCVGIHTCQTCNESLNAQHCTGALPTNESGIMTCVDLSVSRGFQLATTRAQRVEADKSEHNIFTKAVITQECQPVSQMQKL